MAYRKPYREQLKRVAKLDKRELALNIREMTGATLREAESAIEGA